VEEIKVEKLEWVNVEEKLPAYGEPVLIKINGVTQHVTYALYGDSDVPDWFKPYHFDNDYEHKISRDKVSFWCYLPK
jgi:hypothetical protein